MRRLLSIAGIVALAALAVVAIGWRSPAQGSSTGRFDVIFDDARGLIAGQLVKVAGATAGTINNVVVTPDFKARVEASIDSRFLPFHTDARCTIRPEGLIAENYVDCDPGTLGSPTLQATPQYPPTVPVVQTTEPVSLLDLFNIFNLPTRERFTAIIDTLGIGTAGRGADFNAILLRANPALAQARQLIAILNRQRTQLGGALDATSAIATEAASHTPALQGFLDRAAALTSVTAAHRDSLSQGIARLPRLLAVAQPSLQQLDTVARDGTPLVAQLHAAAPALVKVQRDLGPFAATAGPGLADLSQALRRGIPAIRHVTPLVSTLSIYTKRSLPDTQLFAKLTSNLQQHGFVESFLNVAYSVAASLSRHDATSHLLSTLLVSPNNGACSNYAPKPVAGCSAHYGSQPAYTPASAADRSAGSAGALTAAPPIAGPGSGARPGSSGQRAGTLQNLVNFLLR